MISRAEKQKIRVWYNCQWFSYFTCRWCLWLFQSTLWRICHTICSNQGYKMHKPGLRPLLLRVRRSLDTLLNTKSCEKDPHAWQFEGSILVVGPLISIPTNESSQSGIEFFWHSGENFPFRELPTFFDVLPHYMSCSCKTPCVGISSLPSISINVMSWSLYDLSAFWVSCKVQDCL